MKLMSPIHKKDPVYIRLAVWVSVAMLCIATVGISQHSRVEERAKAREIALAACQMETAPMNCVQRVDDAPQGSNRLARPVYRPRIN